MPKVYIKGHEYCYHVSDVMRMFYNNIISEDYCIKTEIDDDFVIESNIEEDVVFTIWGKGKNKKSIREITESNTQKRAVKRQLYIALSDITNIKLPWGSLSGIRPTLVAQETEYNEKILTDYYKVSDIKTRVVIETAKKENEIKKLLNRDDIHCYIGIPICQSRCSYCSFLSGEYKTYKKWVPDYVDALVKEINEILPLIKNKIGSIYIGGGTPSILDEEQLEKFLKAIYNILKNKNNFEFTFEAGRVDSLNKEKLEIMKKYKVNRLCINPQTLNDETLKKIGRNHTSSQFVDIYRLAKNIGFEIINTDIIAGFRNESASDFKNTLNSVINLHPENITVHALSIKKVSGLKKEINKLSKDKLKNEFNAPNALLTDMINSSYEYLRESGYFPYYLYRQKDTAGGQENIGYSQKGLECKYNVAMMGDYNSIIGLGAKSVSKKIINRENSTLIERYHNIRDIILYIKNIDRLIKEKIEFFDLGV